MEMGRSSGKVVDHTPSDRDVLSLNLAACWAFSFTYRVSFNRSLKESVMGKLKPIYEKTGALVALSEVKQILKSTEWAQSVWK